MEVARPLRVAGIGVLVWVGAACADHPSTTRVADSAGVERPIDVDVTTPTSIATTLPPSRSWGITERPELMRFFAGLEICSRGESFALHHGLSMHGYSAFVPSMAEQTVLDGFWRSAGDLGFGGPVQDGPNRVMEQGFKAIGAVDFPFVRVSVRLQGSSLDAGVARARELDFASTRTLPDLVGADGDIEITLHPRGRSLTASLMFPISRRPELERWARSARGVLRLGESDGRLDLSWAETIGQGPTGDACVYRVAPSPPASLDGPAADLLEQMMGK